MAELAATRRRSQRRAERSFTIREAKALCDFPLITLRLRGSEREKESRQHRELTLRATAYLRKRGWRIQCRHYAAEGVHAAADLGGIHNGHFHFIEVCSPYITAERLERKKQLAQHAPLVFVVDKRSTNVRKLLADWTATIIL